MTEQLAIQGSTKSFRARLAKWTEAKLRTEGEKRGIPGAETLDLTTLREAIAQSFRDDLRDHQRVQPHIR
ncbi:MAG TPA: hypothetical protein VFP22_06265 [Candidatus Limnocylindrales bacterium]|nr:hypothetical protein [Candidatus Limnocylindrales bacterium]